MKPEPVNIASSPAPAGPLPATMSAWSSESRGRHGLRIVTIATPAPGPGELLVRVEAAALNFSDVLMLDDAYQVRPARPFVPGQEIAGTVVAAGRDAGFALGDRIAGTLPYGGFAEFAIMPRERAIMVPAACDAAVAAALPIVYTTASVALGEVARVGAHDTVLILAAAGGVGLAAIDIARQAGARVLAAAGGEDKCELAARRGAHATIDYRHERWSERVKDLTESRGVDVVFDPVGGAVTLEALRALAPEARLLIVGFASGEIPAIPANRLLLKRASAIGITWSHDRDGAMLRRVAVRLEQLLACGTVRPHVGRRYGFAQLPGALDDLAGRRTTGKCVLDLSHRPRDRSE